MAFVERRWTQFDSRDAVFLGVAGVMACVAYFAPTVVAKHFAQPLPSAFVKVVTGPGHGSATHIGNGLYVTAAHVVANRAEVTINGVESPVLWANHTYDIALVSGPADVAVVPLACATPAIGQVGQSHGNPVDIADITTTLTVAGAAREMGPWKLAIPMDGTMAPGMSGGAFIVDGSLAGVNIGLSVAPLNAFSGSFYGISIIVPSSVVCSLMGRS